MKRIACSGEINTTEMTCSTGWVIETVELNTFELLDPAELSQMFGLGFAVVMIAILSMHHIVEAIKTTLEIIRYGTKQ